MERALRQSKRFHVIGSVRNAEEAVAYLSGEGGYGDRQLWPFPDLLLMDLKAPSQAGGEVAKWLLEHPRPALKVVHLPSAGMGMEIQTVKALGTEAFQQHTLQNAKLLQLVERLENFLLSARPGVTR